MPQARNKQLICVAPDLVGKAWPLAVDYLETAYATGLGDEDLDTTKAELDKGLQLLWLVWDGHEVLAAATTKLVSTPSAKLCIITSCGGKQLSRWKYFIADLEQYARNEGCDKLRITGRKGWARILPEYRTPWVCIEKRLNEHAR
jgi:hypothetical protein